MKEIRKPERFDIIINRLEGSYGFKTHASTEAVEARAFEEEFMYSVSGDFYKEVFLLMKQRYKKFNDKMRKEDPSKVIEVGE